jgi:hypothetical protein
MGGDTLWGWNLGGRQNRVFEGGAREGWSIERPIGRVEAGGGVLGRRD